MYYVYKDLPITELHPQAYLAAQAAECAGEQGKYWEMHRTLFGQPSEWDSTEQRARQTFTKYATKLELDVEAFEACVDEGRHRDNVDANLEEARHLGLTGTPAFVVNGKLLSGAHPTATFERVIERELESIGQ